MQKQHLYVLCILIACCMSGCMGDSSKQLQTLQDNGANGSSSPAEAGKNTPPVTPDQDEPSELDGIPDFVIPDVSTYCDLWQQDYQEDNLESLNTFALSQSTAILSGSFSEPITINDSLYAPFFIQEVIYGWSFLVGVEVMISLDEPLAERVADHEQWIIGLSSNHPSDWYDPPMLHWGNLMTMIPANEGKTYADLLTYRAADTSQVALVKIVEQDEYRTTFEVVDALKGSFPKYFSDNWYVSWNLPYPGVSNSDIHPELSHWHQSGVVGCGYQRIWVRYRNRRSCHWDR